MNKTENKITSYLNESFYKKLNESVYSISDMMKIDEAFDNILNKCVIIEENRTSSKKYTLLINKELDKQLTIIEKTIKKIFNIDLKINIDVKTKNLSYFACIFIEKEDIDNVKKQIEEIVVNKEYGYHYLKVKKANVLIQRDTFFYIKDFFGERKLSGKHLTAILLHEIGHKVFLKLSYERNKKNYSLKINDQKEIKFSLTEMSAYLISMIVSTLLIYLMSGILQISNNKSYVKNEHDADRLAIEYGYGKELYQFFITIELDFKGKFTTDKDFILTKLFNVDYLRRKEMKLLIMKEINNKENNEEQIKQLKEVLKFIEKIEKEAENKNYSYY